MSNKELKTLIKQQSDIQQRRSNLKKNLSIALEGIEKLKIKIKEAENMVSQALDKLVDSAGTQADVDKARDTLKNLKVQQADEEALIDPYERSIANSEKELQKN
jgi:chromosome segregation ATPase